MNGTVRVLEWGTDWRRSRETITRQQVIVTLSLIVGLAIVLRFIHLGRESYWYDEIIMVRLASMNWDTLIARLVATGRPPLYVVLAKAWADIFGTSEVGTRSLSAVLGILSVLLMYPVGEKLFNRQVGLIGALIMALSSFQVFYAQEFRYYSLVLLLTLLCVLFFLRGLESGRIADFILHGLCGALLFYTHTLAVLLLVAPGLYFLLRWRRFKALRWKWALSQTIAVLGALPWLLPELIKQVQALSAPNARTFAAGSWVLTPPLYAPIRTLMNFMILAREYMPLVAVAAGAVVLLVGVAAFVTVRGWRAWAAGLGELFAGLPAFVREASDGLLFGTLWLLGPILIVFLGSRVLSPFYVDRYMITAAPALYLLVAVAIVYVREAVPLPVALAVLGIWLGGALYTYYVEPVKDQWRETAAFVEANAENGDVLAFSHEHGKPTIARTVEEAFMWYYDGEAETCHVEVQHGVELLSAGLGECVTDRGRVWVVVWEFIPDPTDVEAYFDGGQASAIELLDVERFYGTRVYLFNIVEDLQ